MSRSGLRSRILAALCLVVLPGSGLAQPSPGEVLEKVATAAASVPCGITSVTVTGGGHRVAGAEDGVVFPPNLSRLASEAKVMLPAFAVSLQTEVTLKVGVKACNRPDAECRWVIEPFRPQQARGALIGFEGTGSCGAVVGKVRSGSREVRGDSVDIVLPKLDEIGIYQLRLFCGSADQSTPQPPDLPDLPGSPDTVDPAANLPPLAIPIPFFVTYAEPLSFVSPPEFSWYLRAACWAGGLTHEASEKQVLDQIHDKLYDHGKLNWRYGYTTPGEIDGTYEFYLFSSPAGSRKITYAIDNDDYLPVCPTTCKCRWQGLIGLASPCKFADCYVFSETLEAMAAVMGVGGLQPIAITGEAGKGFLTQPAASLDPKFTGSVGCLETPEGKEKTAKANEKEAGEDTCYPYYFTTHSLRLRDGVFYDATFGGTHKHKNDSIALSEDQSTEDFLTFLDSDRVLVSLGRHYGTFGFYVDPPTRFEKRAALFTGESIKFVNHDVVFTPQDTDADGVYEFLDAEFEVQVLRPGSYVIHGSLTQGQSVVANRPNWWSAEPASALVNEKPGTYSIVLTFSGQQIRKSAKDGQYEFSAATNGRDFQVQTLRATSEADYNHDDFGELNAVIEDNVTGRGVDSNNNGKFDDLEIQVPYNQFVSGTFPIQVRLAKHGRTIAYAGSKENREANQDKSVILRIPGHKIAASRADGPYQLTVVLYSRQLAALVDVFDENFGGDLKASSFERADVTVAAQ